MFPLFFFFCLFCDCFQLTVVCGRNHTTKPHLKHLWHILETASHIDEWTQTLNRLLSKVVGLCLFWGLLKNIPVYFCTVAEASSLPVIFEYLHAYVWSIRPVSCSVCLFCLTFRSLMRGVEFLSTPFGCHSRSFPIALHPEITALLFAPPHSQSSVVALIRLVDVAEHRRPGVSHQLHKRGVCCSPKPFHTPRCPFPRPQVSAHCHWWNLNGKLRSLRPGDC